MRTVPVLLLDKLLKCIEIILKYRNDARVPAKNTFLFVIPRYNKSYFKFLNACELMRRFSTECGTERPWTLCGTGLRKHVDTISVALDLSENDVSDLVQHMSHAIAIHKEIYRQPVISKDIVRMSQVLEKSQGVNNYDTDGTDDTSSSKGIEYSVESSMRSYETESDLSLNTRNTNRRAKKQNGIHKNEEHLTNNINISDEINAEPLSTYNDSSQSQKANKKRNSK